MRFGTDIKYVKELIISYLWLFSDKNTVWFWCVFFIISCDHRVYFVCFFYCDGGFFAAAADFYCQVNARLMLCFY